MSSAGIASPGKLSHYPSTLPLSVRSESGYNIKMGQAKPLQILFVCVENACRSQVAQAFAAYYGQGRVEAQSAGSRPRGSVDSTAIAVMRERGIDMSAHTSKGLADLPSIRWDAIVTMGCGDVCPQLPATRRIDWQIPDPARQPVETYRAICDLIERHIKALLEELSLSRVKQ